ncbi:GGDEF domain-containing protein [Nitrogeniibacter mangrovi]|uniref:diguanylate cyclase n=1 Tax=Nitrogeniibacter mangrovi TaxID=2016596 RepID=A0A6C1B5D6_9RHOO|nr:sensor domain-containing diguanylate cyclase [Nitrogeniibacter mangrovi]QID18653.1 GGDEF domain-containing protein [Nitrogeniibacter mangrovi]
MTSTGQSAPADTRLSAYVEAVRAMREGRYAVDIPLGAQDDVGRLGAELQQLAEHLSGHVTQVLRMQAISDTVNGGLTLIDVLDRIFDAFRTVIPYNRMGCALLSADGRTLRSCWARADFGDVRLGTGFTASMANSSLNQVIASGQPRILNDLDAHLRQHPDSHSTRLMLAEGIRSSLTCPLISQGKPVGFLFFSSTEPFTYQGVHQGLYLRIAAQLSAIIEKGRLYQELVEVNARLLATQDELQELATRDPLTGVFNRRGILDHLKAEYARARREGGPISLIIVDVDHFKKINDQYGHSTGDGVLWEIAQRLAGGVRQYNQLGRFGGEEFLIVMSNVECGQGPCIAERLCKLISAQPIEHEGLRLDVTISAGLVHATDPATVACEEALIRLADEALYEAKRAGRNRFSCRTAGGAALS